MITTPPGFASAYFDIHKPLAHQLEVLFSEIENECLTVDSICISPWMFELLREDPTLQQAIDREPAGKLLYGRVVLGYLWGATIYADPALGATGCVYPRIPG